jgi:hypothetical protein
MITQPQYQKKQVPEFLVPVFLILKSLTEKHPFMSAGMLSF